MKIVILDDYADAFRQVLGPEALAGHEVTVYRDAAASADDLVARLSGADAAVLIQQRTPLPAAVIEQLPKLKLICQTGRHVAHIDVAACDRMGITISAGGSGSTAATAELTWALILAAARDLPRQLQRLRDGLWLDSIGTTLSGRTLGIYAYGRIGSMVAKIGRAMDMRVVCWGREASTASAREAGYEIAPDRAAFFAMADVLTLHLPLNDATRGIITAADLAAMKPTAILVNTSRAGIIAPGALYAALSAGRPGFGAVDVYETEPVLGANYPLLRLPNVLCSPHLGYSTDTTYRGLLTRMVEYVEAFSAGKPADVVNHPA